MIFQIKCSKRYRSQMPGQSLSNYFYTNNISQNLLEIRIQLQPPDFPNHAFTHSDELTMKIIASCIRSTTEVVRSNNSGMRKRLYSVSVFFSRKEFYNLPSILTREVKNVNQRHAIEQNMSFVWYLVATFRKFNLLNISKAKTFLLNLNTFHWNFKWFG